MEEQKATQSQTKTITYSHFVKLTGILNAINYKKRDRFTYACNKIGNKIDEKIIKEYNDKLNEIDQECCKKEADGSFMQKEVITKDKGGNTIITKTGHFIFDKEGRKKQKKMVEDLMKEIVEVPVYFAQEYEKNEDYQHLTLQQRNLLAGIILPIDEVDEDDDDKAYQDWLDTAPKEEKEKSNSNSNGVPA